jgi:hypothetical protein
MEMKIPKAREIAMIFRRRGASAFDEERPFATARMTT